KTIKVRLDGIDAPERGQPYGTQAKKFTSSLAYGKHVTVTPNKTVRYGRTVGRVKVDGRDLSSALVGSGMAWHYKKYSKDSKLGALESSARSRKAGLWSSGSNQAPWEYRKSKHSTYSHHRSYTRRSK